MPRSIGQILPKPFEEVGAEDVATLVGDVASEPKSVVFELKVMVRPEPLAKTCAAFANSIGGLFVGGVDPDGALIGMERPGGEVQLWVKNVLRYLVLPLPPFRARWLELDREPPSRGLLLVLVEESSVTPHLLPRRGAIYVRGPGSSDPLPIADQRQLIELISRGERARSRAEERVQALGDDLLLRDRRFAGAATKEVELLLIVPTGSATESVGRLLFSREGAQRLGGALLKGFPEDGPKALPPLDRMEWEHDVARTGRTIQGFDGVESQWAMAWRDGSVALARSFEPRGQELVLQMSTIEDRFAPRLAAGRALCIALGGHGDLRLLYALRCSVGRTLFWSQTRAGPVQAERMRVVRWTTVDEDRPTDLRADVFAEVARHVGLGPPV